MAKTPWTRKRLHELDLRQTRRVFDHRGNILEPSRPQAPAKLPKITIVTPSYNQGDYLEECILSVLGQNYPNLEYIIMDGGSTDQSVDIIRKYEKHLAYWQSQPDDGQYAAIDAGFRRSTGDILAWLNSDDKYHPGAFATVADVFSRYTAVDWLTGRPSVWDAEGALFDVHLLRNFSRDDYCRPRHDFYLQQENTFWRKSLWDAAGGRIDPTYALAGDFELWTRFFEHAELHVVDALLGGFRVHPKQKTATAADRYVEEARRASTALAARHPPQPVPKPRLRCELATSLVPNNVSQQLRAVQSWQALGFEVTSLNSASEIAQLEGHYPDVKFVEMRRNGADLVGKPCIFIDDILGYFRTSDADYFGIVNSDVILWADRSLPDFLGRESRGALVYGSRVEVPGRGSAIGYTYHVGFDYFFFDRALLGIYPASKFMLGIPWWDYWFPLWPALQGFPVKCLDAYIAYHVSHAANYKSDDLYTFMWHFTQLAATPSLSAKVRCLELELKDGQAREGKVEYLEVFADSVRRALEIRAEKLVFSAGVTRFNEIALGAGHEPIRVTAIVSTYASESFIAGCLDNLLGQTVADAIEIIVIDAASPQDEGAIVEDYRRRHGNVRYVRTPERIGVYAAWNMAARMARGRYLVSCSTNDRLRSNAIEELARMLDERPDAALAYGKTLLTRVPNQGFDEATPHGVYLWGDATFESLLRSPNVGPHAMWRRSLHDELGYFDENFAAIADQDFWLRIARRHLTVRIGSFTGCYLVDDESLSGNRARAASEIREIHERHAIPYSFAMWRQAHRMNRALAERIERRMPDEASRVRFRVWLIDRSARVEDLTASISALARQIYPNVAVKILSPMGCPPQLAGGSIAWHVSPPAVPWLPEVAGLAAGAPSDRVWDLVLPMGARIEPHFLLLLGDALSRQPAWRFLHFDDAVTDPASGLETPAFRAAFDLDWACCANALGTGFSLRSDQWAAIAGDLGRESGAESLDTGFAVHDRCGPDALGHFAELAWTCDADRVWPRSPEAEAQAILRHLRRQPFAATLMPGAAIDNFRVRYGKEFAPSVSVVIVHAGNDADLDGALRSIADHSQYPGLEIVIATSATRSDYIDGLRSLGHANLRVVDTPPRSDSFAALTTAMEAANGDLAIVFDAESRVVQADWVHQLVHFFVRPDIGAVGPRLIYPDGLIKDGGRVLGLHGPSGAPDCGVRLEYAGIGGRLAVDRQVSSLSGECLVLRRAVWPALAEACRPQGDENWTLGVCLTLSAAGLRLIWTPHATVMGAGDSYGMEDSDRERFESVWTKAEDASYQRWLPRLARDPHFSPHHDRHSRGCVPEVVPALNWDPAPDPTVPKVYIHLADFAGQGHHRILEPFRLMAQRSTVRGGVSTRPLLPAEMAAVSPDAWIFQRQTKKVDLLAMRHCRRYGGGAPVIYEIDDLITALPPESPHYKDFGPEVRARFDEALTLADRVVVSTEVLAQQFAGRVAEIRVRPNALATDRWAGLAPRRGIGARPRVGWAGSPSHAGDLEVLKEIVPKLAREVDWIFMGFCPRELRSFAVEIHPWCGLDDYPSKMAGLNLDLALAPLAVNAFNEAKSHLKLLEYGILGYPVICTDIAPYRGDFPVRRLRNKAGDWLAAIRESVNEPAANAAAGDALREHVRHHWMLDDHLDDWLAAWSGR